MTTEEEAKKKREEEERRKRDEEDAKRRREADESTQQMINNVVISNMFNNLFGFLLGLLLLVGCAHHKVPFADQPFLDTPAGYHLKYFDQGSVSTGRLSLEDVHTMFDRAAANGVRHLFLTYQVDPEVTLAKAKAAYWTAIDNWRFQVDLGTGTLTWVSGVTPQDNSWSRVAMYDLQTGANADPDAPPWTQATNAVGLHGWGVLDNPFPAWAHEVGHMIFGAAFEHPELGWKWPQK